MSALAALKGYRTQFLYSLHYILKHQDSTDSYHLEGTEDLDILNQQGQVQYFIQVKNLSKPITLSDLFAETGTSFIRRFLAHEGNASPVLVSFGQISDELKSWKNNTGSILSKEKTLLQKYKITESDWIKVKANLIFEQVSEDDLVKEIYDMLKAVNQIDPVPTLENLLYWIPYIAEKQVIITFRDIFEKIESIAVYLSERIAITNRYGIYIKALHQTDLSLSASNVLEEEYYFGINARYEHILTDQDVSRLDFLNEINSFFDLSNTVIIHGASGQGKTSLAYRYARNNSPGSLIYEILIQEDPAATNAAILALHAITKKLNVPVLLIINVAPNTTSWLKIIEATSVFNSLNCLVTIRNEDWFRAKSSGVNFMFSEVELSLSENEAALIYKALLQKRHKTKYIDFKEAWLDLGQRMPLMEFTYAITQGESLFNRLQQQVLLLNVEEQAQKAPGQLALLRIISLADFFGARINVAKLKLFPGIQFIIQKFEREYLLKQIDDKKYITGLHPIRSKLLCDLLFDEFAVTRKDEIINCLEVIDEADAYPFLLKCFYDDLISPAELIEIVRNRKDITWLFYRAVIKSLLWAGTRKYVATNENVLEEAHQLFGDAWLMLLDIYHHTQIDIHQILGSLGVDQQKMANITRLNEMLASKSLVFESLISFFQTVPLPQGKPASVSAWSGLAETLFWLSHVPHTTVQNIQVLEEDFKGAFTTLDVDVLSKLMLGLHLYSPVYDGVRLKYAPIFVEKLRQKYLIPHLKIDEEVTVNYVLDIINETEGFSVHDHVLEIIDLLHDAFPDKKKYNTQAHGHRNTVIQLPFDDSQKAISSENLMFEEWSNLNANLRKLYEYAHRPADWTDYIARIQNWESNTKKIIHQFTDAFAELKRANGSKLMTIIEQCNYDYGYEIKSPKSIADPFGLHVRSSKTKSESLNLSSGTLKEHTLNERHQLFFKSYREYKNDIENFFRQSGQVVYQILGNISDPTTSVDSHLLHLSHINLFNAIVHRGIYVAQKNKSFKDMGELSGSEVSEIELLNAATIWKGFITALPSNNFKNLALKERITVIKSDFESAIIKSLRKLSKETGYNIRYLNSQTTNFSPILVIDAPTSAEVILAVSYCYDLLKDLVNEPEYASLKQLMLLRYFDVVSMVPLVSGNTFNHNWYKFPGHLLRETTFKELKLHQLMTHPIPEHIITNLQIGNWIDIYPPMNDVFLLHVEYVKMRLIVEHLADLQYFDKIEDLDDLGRQLVVDHMEKISAKMQVSFQYVLDKLTHILQLHEFNYLDDESERIYREDMVHIQKNLFPTPKGDEVNYQAKLDMNIIVDWADRLSKLNDSWGRFILILQHKYLQSFKDLTPI